MHVYQYVAVAKTKKTSNDINVGVGKSNSVVSLDIIKINGLKKSLTGTFACLINLLKHFNVF